MTTSNFVWKGAEILAGVESAVVDLVNENAEAVADKARSRVHESAPATWPTASR